MAPKKKQEKMNLGEFLTNQSLGSWADEMDSQPLPLGPSGYGARDRGEQRSFTQPAWESARTSSSAMMDPRGASYDRPRFADREQLPLPTRPPFTAHLGNLAYDVTQTDIEDFLRDCHTTSIRIVEDKLDRKPKGFGYVEFATLDGLKIALTKTESNFMGRNIKISVAEPSKDRAESNRDLSDWSRKGPLPELPQSTRQPSNRGFSRNFDNMSDAGSERGGTRRSAFFDADNNKVRDFGNWERKGPLSPVPTTGPPMRDGGRLREAGPPRERGSSPAWGEGRSETGSRPPRPERVPTAAEMDTQWRTKMKPDSSPAPATPDASAPTSPAAKEAPKERPRLNLAKRTVSTTPAPADAATAPTDKASPFGAARPIDTATREREIDEKRALAARQRQEAELKAKEEKATQDAAARAARAERADRGQVEEEVGGKSSTNAAAPTAPRGGGGAGGTRRASRQQLQQQNGTKGSLPPQQQQQQAQQAKENGETKERPNFTILSREEDGGEADEEGEGVGEGEEGAEGVDTPANGSIIGAEKAIHPREVVVPETDGAKTKAQELEEEGWSTVASKGKSARRGGGNGAPRAVAS